MQIYENQLFKHRVDYKQLDTSLSHFGEKR